MKTNTKFDQDKDIEKWPLAEGRNSDCYILGFKVDKTKWKYRVLKKLHDESGATLDVESTALESYDIPLIPKIFDKSSNYPAEPCYWILIDYIPGATLFEMIQFKPEFHNLKAINILKIISGILYQLYDMENKNIKHRDLSSNNIIIDGNLIPHIIDWGDSTTKNLMSMTTQHGTVPFTAPEVFNNQRTTKSDIYSFGSIIFHLITGSYPYQDAYTTIQGFEHYKKIAKGFDDNKELQKHIESLKADSDDNENIINLYKALEEEEDCEDEFELICQKINPIMTEIIKRGITDQRYIYDADFLRNPLNEKLSAIIDKCWEKDTDERIGCEQLIDEITEIAEQVLTQSQLDEYNLFIDEIGDDSKKEYGTLEMLKLAHEKGLYHGNEALRNILKTYGYKMDDRMAKYKKLLSLTPFYKYSFQ